MYYNLRKIQGTFKGLIGELMFHEIRKKSIIPSFSEKQKYIGIINKYLTREQEIFLLANWHTIDAIELIDFRPTLYEIKTKNYYKNFKAMPPKFTQNQVEKYKEAISKGFEVKLATIRLFDDWRFSVSYKDFKKEKLNIDKPKFYDKKIILLNPQEGYF